MSVLAEADKEKSADDPVLKSFSCTKLQPPSTSWRQSHLGTYCINLIDLKQLKVWFGRCAIRAQLRISHEVLSSVNENKVVPTLIEANYYCTGVLCVQKD